MAAPTISTVRHSRRPTRPPRRGRSTATAATLEGGVAAVALAVFSAGAGAPSVWRDEAATLAAARRSLPDLLALSGTEDLVHTAYYLVVHLVLQVSDTVTAARAVSVVAFAAVAALLVRLGRRLGSTAVGTAAAAVLVVTPIASRYAQNARSEGLVLLLATVATLLLLRCLDGWRRADAIAYGVTVAALGVVNLVGVLLLLAHGVVVLALARDRRREALRWAAAVAGASLVLAPFAAVAWTQRGQIGWMTRPGTQELTTYLIHASVHRVLLAAILLAGAGAAVVLGRRVPGDGVCGGWCATPYGTALLVGGTWGLLPPVGLWSLSQAHPLWDEHYVMFCLPGWTLAVAALPFLAAQRLRGEEWEWLRSAVGALAAAVLVAVLAVAGLGQQQSFRDAATGHEEDLSGAARYVAEHAVPGDGVLFSRHWLRMLVAAEPDRFTGLVDAALAQDPIASGSLSGVEVTPDRLPSVLAERPRLWVLDPDQQTMADATPTDLAKPAALLEHFRLVDSVQLYGIAVLRYERV